MKKFIISNASNIKTQYVYDGRTSVAQIITSQVDSKVAGLSPETGFGAKVGIPNTGANSGIPSIGTNANTTNLVVGAKVPNPTAALARANATPKITSFTYTLFGEQLGKVGTDKATGFGFNGEYFDGATGMLNLRARQYEPTMNRFSQKDRVRGSIAPCRKTGMGLCLMIP